MNTATTVALDGVRVLITHDWLVDWGGAERCTEQMLEVFPDAELVAGVVAEGIRDRNAVTRRARETWLGRVPGARTQHRWFLPLEGIAFGSLDTRPYDLVLSSSYGFAKMVRPSNGGVHICYCHSPPRYLWDFRQYYLQAARGLEKVAFAAAGGVLRRWDRRSARHVDHFVCNSRYVADRISRSYGRTAHVIYPPVSPKPLNGVPPRREEFLLFLGRLVPYKRVDLAIRAAERLGVKLVVAGRGPDRRRLEQLAGPHTQFAGEVSEEEAGRLLSSASAFVFCGEEDFGIAPVEANAHGTPVVAYRGGGLLEGMQDGVTAEFFEERTVDGVVAALRRALERPWDARALKANAERFRPERFRQELAAYVRERLNGRVAAR